MTTSQTSWNDPAVGRRVRRNTFFKAAGESMRVFSMILFVLIARILGGAPFGVFSVAFALATFFVTLTDGGLNQLMIREIALGVESAHERVELTLGIKLSLIPLILFALAAWMLLFHYPKSALQLGLLCGGIAVTKSLVDYFFAICSGHEQMNTESALKAFHQSAGLLLGAWALFKARDIQILCAALIATNVITVLLAYLQVRAMRYAPRTIRVQWPKWLSLWKEGLPLAVAVVINALFLRVDIIMLSLYKTPDLIIGQFAVSTKVFEAMGALPALLCTALFPIMADNAKNRPMVFVEMFRKWRIYLLGLGTLFAILLVVGRHLLLSRVFGTSYEPAATTLMILALSFPSMYLNYWLINNLVVLGEQRYVAIVTGAALGTNIVTNLFLIPLFGGSGTALSILLSQTVMAATSTYFLRASVKRLERLRIAEIKSGLTHYYRTATPYFKQLDDFLEEQLEHLVFGESKLFDWVKKAGSVLEVGCGSGVLMHHIKKTYPDKRVAGVDLSPIGIEMARKRALTDHLDIEYLIADVEARPPFPKNSFDLVVCHEVLEHLTNPLAAIDHMSQMIAPGGYLVLVFPNRCIRAPFTIKLEKLWDTLRMVLDSTYIPLRFEIPPFDRVGSDADATYIAHPWEVQRMVKRTGLQIRYQSLLRGRLVAQR